MNDINILESNEYQTIDDFIAKIERALADGLI